MQGYEASHTQYHQKCLVELYNRVRQHLSGTGSHSGDDQYSLPVQGVALAELASYVKESALNDETTSVFKLSDLTKFYAERLNQLGCCITSKVKSTMLKERLMKVLPELRVILMDRRFCWHMKKISVLSYTMLVGKIMILMQWC